VEVVVSNVPGCIDQDLFDKLFFFSVSMKYKGPGSTVGIATGYGLDGPGSNPGGGIYLINCFYFL
jgi:hypothetical protein